MFHKDRVGAEGRGVLLYVRENLNHIECNLDSELIGIK